MSVPAHRDADRAGDADRQRVVDLLGRAQAEGRLDLHEYDERIRTAWASRTYAELERVMADLPVERVAETAPARVRQDTGAPAHGHGMDAAVRAWAVVSGINLMIWGLVSLTATSWVYPWWIWVAGPWGVVLLVSWVAGRGSSRGRGAATS